MSACSLRFQKTTELVFKWISPSDRAIHGDFFDIIVICQSFVFFFRYKTRQRKSET